MQMKKLYIHDTDKFRKAAEKHLVKKQRNAHARILTPGSLLEMAKTAEQALENRSLPKRLRKGTRYVLGPELMPHAYKYRSASTVAELERGSRGWYVCLDTLIRQNDWTVRGGSPRARSSRLTNAALEYLLAGSIFAGLVRRKVDEAYVKGRDSSGLAALNQ